MKKFEKMKFITLVIGTIAILGFIAYTYCLRNCSYPIDFAGRSMALLGQMGDAFGAFTSLVNLMAFLAILYSISQTREEIDCLKEDIQNTADAQKNHTLIMEKQNKLVREQIDNDILQIRAESDYEKQKAWGLRNTLSGEIIYLKAEFNAGLKLEVDKIKESAPQILYKKYMSSDKHFIAFERFVNSYDVARNSELFDKASATYKSLMRLNVFLEENNNLLTDLSGLAYNNQVTNKNALSGDIEKALKNCFIEIDKELERFYVLSHDLQTYEFETRKKEHSFNRTIDDHRYREMTNQDT